MSRRASWLLVVGATAALVGQVSVGSAGAQGDGEAMAPSFYSAAAQADGMRLGMFLPDGVAVVTNQVIDGSGPHAQAVLDSLGSSTSRAAMPYPGEAAVSGPGIVAGVANLPFSLPDYPFYVAATSPARPESKFEGGGFAIRAAARPTSADSSAVSGNDKPPVAHFLATARVDFGDKGIVAESVSRSEMLTVGELTIGSVFSRARVSQAVGAQRERATEFTATGLKIAGKAFGVTAQGLVYPDGKTPLPSQDPVRALLTQTKTSVSYVGSEQTPDGIISAGIAVTTVQPIPGTGKNGTFTIALGRSFASAQIAGGEEASSQTGLPGGGSESAAPGESVFSGETAPVAGDPAPPAALSTAVPGSPPGRDGGHATAFDAGFSGSPPSAEESAPQPETVQLAETGDVQAPREQSMLVGSSGSGVRLAASNDYLEGPYRATVVVAFALVLGGVLLRIRGVRA